MRDHNHNSLITKCIAAALMLAFLSGLSQCQAATITRKDALKIESLQVNRGNALARKLLEATQPMPTKVDSLLAPNRDMLLQTSLAQVRIRKGSVILLREDKRGDTVAIYNLHDTSAGSVSVTCGNEAVSLAPGASLMVTRKAGPSFSSLNLSPKLGYRNVLELKAQNGLRAFKAEFSIVAAVSTLGSAKKFDKLSKSVIKTAAIQTLLTAKHGPFKQAKI